MDVDTADSVVVATEPVLVNKTKIKRVRTPEEQAVINERMQKVRAAKAIKRDSSNRQTPKMDSDGNHHHVHAMDHPTDNTSGIVHEDHQPIVDASDNVRHAEDLVESIIPGDEIVLHERSRNKFDVSGHQNNSKTASAKLHHHSSGIGIPGLRNGTGAATHRSKPSVYSNQRDYWDYASLVMRGVVLAFSAYLLYKQWTSNREDQSKEERTASEDIPDGSTSLPAASIVASGGRSEIVNRISLQMPTFLSNKSR